MANIIPIDGSAQTLQTPLALLREVRDALQSGKQDAQQKLDRLVHSVAKSLKADVCSIYLTRPGDVLELCASYGLNPQAVHATRLRVGEGLVGDIAAHAHVINLENARTHSKFVYRAETGEDAYQSFVGVPLLHSHKVVGVLVVQSIEAHHYSEALVEMLHAVAMIIAEMAVGSQLVDVFDIAAQNHPSLQSRQFTGKGLVSGVAMAPIVLHRPHIEIKELLADDPDAEEKRLLDAIATLHQSVDAMISAASLPEGSEQLDILETYRLFSQDRGWVERIIRAIHSGLTAEAAVRKVQEEMHARLSQIQSKYIRARAHDLEDLSQRLLYHLSGIDPIAAHGELPDAFVLVAKNLGPAELLEYDANCMKAVVLEEGSASSHVAIIARMMEVPIVGHVGHISAFVRAGDLAIVQGDEGVVFVRPPEDVIENIADIIALKERRRVGFYEDRALAPITRDGADILLNLNVGLVVDGAHLDAPDVKGIGLFRTELPYLAAQEFPSVEDQIRVYRDAFDKADGKRVIFRSFDIGGDKQVPYIKIDAEENPAMGWRATRIGLDRPVVLRQQFRALIRACNGRDLWLMFPFIAEVAEFDAAKKLLMKEIKKADHDGLKVPANLKIGSMIEIPSLLFQLDELMKRVGFVSIGSNDLMQFLFAFDRSSAKLSSRYDALSPAMIRVIRHIAAAAKPHKVEVGFCGDLATRPLEAMVLLGCGIRSLSMPPSAIGPVKAMLRTLDIGALEAFLNQACMDSAHSLRERLEYFARDHGVEIGAS
jgi:phosphotransferase system enzyme I (PtsP)